jgi:hypothetical protein
MHNETTENLEQAFQEHIKAMSARTEQMHYVYHNGSGLILCISNIEMPEFSDKPLCMFPTSDVIDFLEGTKATNEYVIVVDEKTLQHTIKKREVKLELVRSVSRFLNEIEETGFNDAMLEILCKPTEKKIRFRLNPAIRKELGKIQAKTVTIQGFLHLHFYFTAPSDPTFLVEEVVLSAEQLINQEESWISVEQDLSKTSLFAKKVFPTYSYVINEG